MTTVTTTHPRSPAITCDLQRLTDDERRRHVALCGRLFASADEVRVLPDGYAVRLPASPGALADAAEFVRLDRLCCPFIRHGVDAEPAGGPVWLLLTGGEGAKEAIAADVARLLRREVADAAGLAVTAG